MKTAILAGTAALALAAIAADEAPELEAQAIAAEAQSAQVDPSTGKVWDGGAMEWVPFEVYRRRLIERGSRVIEQVPFTAPAIANGFAVLAERDAAIRRHWDHVLYLQDLTNSPLRFVD